MPLFFPSPIQSNSLLKRFKRLLRTTPVDNGFLIRSLSGLSKRRRLAGNSTVHSRNRGMPRDGSALLGSNSDFFKHGFDVTLISKDRNRTGLMIMTATPRLCRDSGSIGVEDANVR